MMRPVFAVPTRIVAQVGFFAPMNLRTTVRVTRPTEDRGGCVLTMGLRDRHCPTHAR